jgi:hypothetical protein
VLQPNERGELLIGFDTRRFQGRKTACLFLHMDNGKMIEARLTISAVSLDLPKPFPG